jgi:hypothetical protein
MDYRISPAKIHALLTELCVELGFCLPPGAVAQLKSNPPADAGEFTDAVIRAEELDPYADIPVNLHWDVRDIPPIACHGRWPKSD